MSEKLVKINRLAFISLCTQPEDQQLQNSTNGCCYLSQSEAKVM